MFPKTGVLGPLIKDHTPDCGDIPGSEPDKVVLLPEQATVISLPAVTLLGANIEILIVSRSTQAPDDIDHTNTFTPLELMVTFEVALFAFAKLTPPPLATVHVPVDPGPAALAASVKVPVLQFC
jgi:hypothetical protein